MPSEIDTGSLDITRSETLALRKKLSPRSKRQIAAHHLQEALADGLSKPYCLRMRSTSSGGRPRPPRDMLPCSTPAVDGAPALEFSPPLVKRAVTSPRPFNCDIICSTGPPGAALDDEEIDHHDAEQGRHHQHQPAQDVDRTGQAPALT